MRTPGSKHGGRALPLAHSFDIALARSRLEEQGGYEIVHESPGLEIGVYVLVAPEPDREQPHEDDEVYIVLDGNGVLDVEGSRVELFEGEAVFVPAGVRHQFVGYEHNFTVLVIYDRAFRPADRGSKPMPIRRTTSRPPRASNRSFSRDLAA